MIDILITLLRAFLHEIGDYYMSSDYPELDKLAKSQNGLKWAYYKTDIGTFKFSWKGNRKKKDIFIVHYAASELTGFFNNGAMLLSDVKRLLASHKGELAMLDQ